MKLDETKHLYAVYAPERWSVLCVFDDESEAHTFISKQNTEEHFCVFPITMNLLIKCYETISNTERRYA